LSHRFIVNIPRVGKGNDTGAAACENKTGDFQNKTKMEAAPHSGQYDCM